MNSDRNRVYLAARYSRREQVLDRAATLESMGYRCVSRWLTAAHVDYPEGGLIATPFWQDWARGDLEDVAATDILIFFSEPYGARVVGGGRHTEFGYALALGKRVCIVGEREQIFHCLPAVEHFDTWEECLEALRDGPVESVA